MPEQSIMPTEPQDDGRERIIWLSMVGLGIIVAAIVLALGWGAIGGRLAGARRIDEATKTLKETSVTLQDLDATLRSDIDTDTTTRAKQEIEKVTSELDRVNAIPGLVNEHAEKLTDDERRQAALVAAAAQAQSATFTEGIALLRQLEPIWSVREVLDPAWAATLAIDKRANESVNLYATHTRANVRRAEQMNTKAMNAYRTTRDWFRGAAAKLPDVNLSGYIDYITERMKALDTAQRANRAWLAGDSATAEQLMATYREKDAKLALQLQIFPAAPSVWIDQSFKQQLELPSSAYYKAREKAVQGEQQLRIF